MRVVMNRSRGRAEPASALTAAPVARLLPRWDLVVALLWFGAAWIVYAGFALRLAQGVYSDYYNLAFDFDPPRTVQTLALSPAERQGFRHPLIVLLRPLTLPFLAGGFSPKAAAALVIAGFGGGAVALSFLYLRTVGVRPPEASALVLLFAVTGAQIFNSIIVETFGIAGFSIVLIWLCAAARFTDPLRLRILRYIAAVLAFGVTITNVVQAFIAEFVVWRRHDGIRQTIRRTIVFGLIGAVVASTLVLAVWHVELWAAAKDPILALKEVYWMRPTAPREAGLGKLLLTFFGFSFVSPEYTWVKLSDAEPIMRDFRDYALSPLGRIAMPLWLAFWTVGAVAALRHPRYRWLALGLCAAIVFNLLVSMDFQNRDSVYLYSSHLHFLIFALGAGLALYTGSSLRTRALYIAVVLLLAGLIGGDNLPLVAEFAGDFDRTPVSYGSGEPVAPSVQNR
jgi:hypothetical protein